ncbi:MAG: hypothetical protein AAGD38_00515 [Acidobacteriota bacterium]
MATAITATTITATPPNLGDLLVARAHDEQPWLFWREDYDWCWLSFRQAVDQIARTVERLHARDIADTPSPIAYDAWLSPDAIAADLALHCAGRSAVPARHADDADTWLSTDDDLVEARSRLDRWDPEPLAISGELGGVILEGRRLDATAQLDSARRLERTLAPKLEDTKRPTVAVITSALDEPWVRELVWWSLLTRSALILEPSLAVLASTAHWARPHLVSAPVSALRSFAANVTGRPRRHKRLRLVIGERSWNDGNEQVWEPLDVAYVAITQID